MARAMSHDPTTSCVFCRMLRGELTPQVIAFRDSHTAVFPSLHQQPLNRGHTLVIPTRHVPNIYDLDPKLTGPLMTTLARVATAVKSICRADGITIRQNNDPAGGQDVFHLHIHVIPRIQDDGFTILDRSRGVTEVALDECIEQARRLSEALRSK
jgi:histidine triad (HIT) family protein